ncbi:MAG: FtsX-like permease family protein, partial [Clostridia bacterium]|nr:FtsX-like permease family protein [Clostridia bacterium]
MTMLYSLGGVVIFIIIVSSIFVIKNSFSISITEKIKQYGILSSIGATSKQIKKNVLFEGFVLGIIAIPLGILCGMFAVFVLIHLMNFILAEALNGITFVYKVPYLPILITILFSSITIYFSSIFSARKAGKISPIEAIRSNSEIKISSKKVRGSKIIKRIFKIGGDISYKNLKRNKRKYRTTVISLIVSITIFISLSSFIDFGFKMSNEYYKEMNYNFIIYNRQNIEENKENANDFFQEISKNDNVDEYTIYKTKNFLSTSENYSDFGKRYYRDSEADIRLIAVGEEEYKKVLKKIGLDIDECENKGILYDNTTVFENQKKKNGNIYDIKNNSKLTLNFVDKDGIKTEEQLEIDIIKREEKVYP